MPSSSESITNRLPTIAECSHIRDLSLQRSDTHITDDEVAVIIPFCSKLETIDLSGVEDTSDRTVALIANNALNLQAVNLSECTQVTDVGVLEVINNLKLLPLQRIQLNGTTGLTDTSISAIAKSCSHLAELEICSLPSLSPLAVRDIWTFSRKLRSLRLARCPLLTDKSFPSSLTLDPGEDSDNEKPLPHRPITVVEKLPPLILQHRAEDLRILDLSFCGIKDGVIEGIVTHAPRIQDLILSGCSQLTDRALKSICKLAGHLNALTLAHVSNITDAGIVMIVRSCVNINYVDMAFCRNLTDMSIFELAGLKALRHLSLVRVHKITDIAIFALAEHATFLERLHLSYCDQLSLDSIHTLLKTLGHLKHLTATGVPSFKREGISRFSEKPPHNCDPDQQAAFRVFNGSNIGRLRRFLNKEEKRRHSAEARSIPFVPRSDDKLDLY